MPLAPVRGTGLQVRAEARIQADVVAWRVEARMIEDVEELCVIAQGEPFVFLTTPKSKRVWNGPRNALRPAVEKPVSEKSHAAVRELSSVVGPQGGTPLVAGALTLMPNAPPLSTGLPAFTPVVP